MLQRDRAAYFRVCEILAVQHTYIDIRYEPDKFHGSTSFVRGTALDIMLGVAIPDDFFVNNEDIGQEFKVSVKFTPKDGADLRHVTIGESREVATGDWQEVCTVKSAPWFIYDRSEINSYRDQGFFKYLRIGVTDDAKHGASYTVDVKAEYIGNDEYVKAVFNSDQSWREGSFFIDIDNIFLGPPTITPAEQSVTIAPGGLAAVTFEGKNAYRWGCDGYDTSVVKGVMALYSTQNSETRKNCEVLVKLADNAQTGAKTTINVNAYADTGRQTTAKLNITVGKDDDHMDPVIEGDKTLNIVPGGTATAVFTGRYAKNWDFSGTGLDAAGIKYVKMNYAQDPNRCEVMVGVSETFRATKTMSVTAYNGAGEPSAPRTLTINPAKEGDYADPVIDSTDMSLSLVPGGTASTILTGTHIRSWSLGGSLPEGIDAVKFDFSSNPNRCEAKVTASPEAQTGASFQIPVCAYNAAGETASATLSVTIADSTSHPDPVIDFVESPKAIVMGGTARVRLTGRNIKSWRHGNLPDILENIDFSYNDTDSGDPNDCYAKVRGANEPTASSGTVKLCAYNDIGAEVSTDLTVTVQEESVTVSFDIKPVNSEPVTVVPGKTVTVELSAIGTTSNGDSAQVDFLTHGDLPDVIVFVEFSRGEDPEQWTARIMASPNAITNAAASTSEFRTESETTVSFDINAFDEAGNHDTTKLKVTLRHDPISGGNGGCDAGLLGVAGLCVLTWIALRRKTR